MRKQRQCFVHPFSSLETLPFSKEEYSYLKFGGDAIARKYGHELAITFFRENSDVLLSNRCVVIPSPYNHVKNAASVMTEHFVNHLNHLLVSANGSTVETSLIHRKVSYVNDYGFLTKEKRRQLIDNDSFYLNEQFVEGKVLIFIDDVCITGTHEDKLVEILDKAKLTNQTFFLYYAKYVGDLANADIESKINLGAISSIDDYMNFRRGEEHVHLLVRPIKFMLSQSQKKFADAISLMTFAQQQELYYACLGEAYHRIPTYQDNFRTLMKHLHPERVLEDVTE